MSFWAANSKCIVSEFSSDLKDYNYLIDFVQFYAYGDLVSGCKHFVNIAEHRENVEEKTLKLFSKHDFVTTVAAALEHLPARNPILERYEKGCREGDMKEYLPWLRKNSRGRMLEIGVRDGASTSAMLLGLEENGGHLHSIDQNDCSKLWTHPRWTFEHNDSKKAIFPDNEFDAALIDGDHTKTGFLADLNNCYRWVKHGGIIMCHDIEAKQTSETCGGDFPSREVGEEYRKFVMGLTHFELPGEFGFGVMVVEK
jgi:predicted O-methyltransferase YrrM